MVYNLSMNKSLIFLIVGLTSGLITNYFLNVVETMGNNNSFLFLPMFLPGIIFGLFSAFSFYILIFEISIIVKFYKTLLWIITSVFAFMASFWFSINSYEFFSFSYLFIVGVIGGLVGSIILSLGFSFIFKKITRKKYLIIAGSVLGGISFMVIDYFTINLLGDSGQPIGSVLHIIWQAGVLYVFSLIIIYNKK